MGLISLSVKYNIATGNTVSLGESGLNVNDIVPMGNVVFNHRYVFWLNQDLWDLLKRLHSFHSQNYILKLR